MIRFIDTFFTISSNYNQLQSITITLQTNLINSDWLHSGLVYDCSEL
jgi:hypothetical protein